MTIEPKMRSIGLALTSCRAGMSLRNILRAMAFFDPSGDQAEPMSRIGDRARDLMRPTMRITLVGLRGLNLSDFHIPKKLLGFGRIDVSRVRRERVGGSARTGESTGFPHRSSVAHACG
jgi:hypothetical protein